MSDEITFAEALRLCGKRGVVEYEHGSDGLGWQEFYINQPYGPHVNMDLLTVANFAESKFRRAKPKRSRVQEMAERFGYKALYVAGLEDSIRAAVQFVRELNPGNFRTGQIASEIERHFLEPR